MSEQEALIVLNAVPGLGNIRIFRLITAFGSARAVFKARLEALRQSGCLPGKLADRLFHFDRDRFLKEEQASLSREGISVVTYLDDHYPEYLKEIPDCPVLFYLRGSLRDYRNKALAIVGSRMSSVCGRLTAQELASDLAGRGFTIVSGLARGIDTAAHQGCLKVGGVTVAVLGSGLMNIYPTENTGLARQIAEQRGAVVSEFPLTALPVPGHFPRRNRIISGLSLGVIVVEAAVRSGALITSRFALEQGREVFAVPGRFGHEASLGTSRLIQQGAKLITSSEDILEELNPDILAPDNIPLQEDPSSGDPPALERREQQVLELIHDQPVSFDRLVRQMSCPAADLHVLLLKLEMKKQIQQLPGKQVVRRHQQ